MRSKQAVALKVDVHMEESLLIKKPSMWTKTKQFVRQKGWKANVKFGAIFTLFVLLINIVVLISAHAVSTSNDHGNLTVLTGSCTTTARASTVANVVINILSTLLLGASNNAMQGLNAPTRSDIDRAHSRGFWLDVGTPSLRNLLFVDTRRTVAWLLLGLSSIPLHLL